MRRQSNPGFMLAPILTPVVSLIPSKEGSLIDDAAGPVVV